MCAVVFVCFSFLWLYYFQADVLAVTQHILSGGQTHYDRTIGALIITVVLLLLQVVIYSIIKLRKFSHALTFFPSMVGLALLTSASYTIDNSLSIGHLWWICPLLMIVWGFAVMAAHKIQPYEKYAASGLFSRCMWVNMLLMVLMTLFVAFAGNTNSVFHFRVHAETALSERNYDEALRVGHLSVETDGSLMMLRMYALSRKGLLGEKLFSYPLVASSDVMLPTGGDAQMIKYPVDSLYRHIGAIPRQPMRPMDYLRTILRSGQAKPAAKDYLLCGYLIDKDLDGFAQTLSRFYPLNDSLPRYYREALVLYAHLRSHPVITYHDAVLNEDFEDYNACKPKLPILRIHRIVLILMKGKIVNCKLITNQ